MAIYHGVRVDDLSLIKLIVILVTAALGVTAVYDPNNPHRTENFDPAEADPTGSISCIGSSYPLFLPVVDGFNPNQLSMQKLCAKPQYNGGLPGQHIGAFCASPPVIVNGNHVWHGGNIGFDVTQDALVNTVLAKARTRLACMYKCWCTHGLPDPGTQPLSDLHRATAESRETYQLTVDVVDDYTSTDEEKRGTLGDRFVDAVELSLVNQVQWTLNNIHYHYLHQPVSLDPANNITCTGDLPQFPLPVALPIGIFDSLQNLCANQFSGGNPASNAGGYCHRTNAFGLQQRDVVFSDELTPRFDWTWEGSVFFGATAIRFYCWQRCACNPASPNSDRVSMASWQLGVGHTILQNVDGSMILQQEDQPQNRLQVLPPQNGPGGPVSGTCGADGKQFCNSTWPASLGPIPHAPPNGTDVIKPDISMQTPPEETELSKPNAGPNTNLTVCGNKCSSQQDCLPSNGIEDCNCAIPTPQDAQTLGLDAVFPIAVCLVLLKVLSKDATKNIHSGKRDVGVHEAGYFDSKGFPYHCVCNATFTASECCGSRDGIVWRS